MLNRALVVPKHKLNEDWNKEWVIYGGKTNSRSSQDGKTTKRKEMSETRKAHYLRLHILHIHAHHFVLGRHLKSLSLSLGAIRERKQWQREL